MASPGRIPSSPPKGASIQEELSYWKSQYDQVEIELQEFQASSKELEAELEKDVEESEKRERMLREKAEKLMFEVDEWKSKYKQSKADASNAQNQLQKEITTLRESVRSMQLKLRDTEVQNDDFERQARHQNSSLEDLESKYNVAIERGVLLEEEIRNNDQERENLRIESQHQRDELSDLKVELEIVQGKLAHAEETLERERARKTITPIATADHILRPPSRTSETSLSATTTTSSPLLATPPPAKSTTSTIQTSPPSPPLSDTSAPAPPRRKATLPVTPMLNKQTRTLPATTPRLSGIRPPRHSRGPSIPANSTPLPSRTLPPQTPRPTKSRLSYSSAHPPPGTGTRTRTGSGSAAPPSSRSLHQVRGLISKMQKLEERVHSARSKLPTPTTPPSSTLPSTVTVRSSRKRTSTSTSTTTSTTNPSSRLSFGFTKPDPISRPVSQASHRTSTTNNTAAGHQFVRPSSRASITGRTTPYEPIHRPRSSISGTYRESNLPPRSTTPSFSRSVSMVHPEDPHGPIDGRSTPVTARKSGIGLGGTGLPTPRRQSGNLPVLGRRQSGTLRDINNSQEDKTAEKGEMRPPSSRGRRLSGVGETF